MAYNLKKERSLVDELERATVLANRIVEQLYEYVQKEAHYNGLVDCVVWAIEKLSSTYKLEDDYSNDG
ncbi:unnamed protein product [Dimorphilus gyrociliatus]|uniref:Uncharacterized protein n=1 Tax=Dimorphilus gyrociliatus TaxID=2664684 RepID=A0A7I8VK00_9ANNE|nr:unnamed protein product [Dimorphilus gyrociliatus]